MKPKSSVVSTALAGDGGVFRRVPLKDIVPSPFQHRKTFKTEDWPGFVDSVRISGVVQPGVAREVNSHVELVCGERRFRASQELKLADMPLLLRPLTDEQVQEIIAVENLQRENLNPLEEAQGYADWIARLLKAATVKTMKEAVAYISERIGKGRSIIYESLRLNKLSPVVRTALAAGKLDPSKAQLFGQVPPDQHARLLKSATETDWNGGTMSTDRLKKLITEEYSRQLSAAPFKLDAEIKGIDPKGCRTHPLCSTCPKRSGNIEGLEGNPNICTDVKCFEGKQEAHANAALAKAQSEGKRVVPPEKYEPRSYEFAAVTDTPWQDTKRRSWSKLAKAAKIEPAVTVNRDGKLLEVFTPEDKGKILAANKIKSSSGGGGGGGGDESRKRAKAKKENGPIAYAATAALLAKCVTAKGIEEKMWRLLADSVAELIGIEREANIARRRGLAEKMNDVRDGLEGWLTRKLTTQQLQEFVVEALLCANWDEYSGKIGTDFKEVCKVGGVNLDKISNEVKAWNEDGHTGHGQTIAAANELTDEVKKIIAGIEVESAHCLQEAMKKPGGLAPDVWAAVNKRLGELAKLDKRIKQWAGGKIKKHPLEDKLNPEVKKLKGKKKK